MSEESAPPGVPIFDRQHPSPSTPKANPQETLPDSRRFRDPGFWVHWAHKEIDRGNKLSALLVLTTGLHHTANEAQLRVEIEPLGLRREAVLPFLHRRNVLNRFLGRARHRLLGPKRLFLGVQRVKFPLQTSARGHLSR